MLWCPRFASYLALVSQDGANWIIALQASKKWTAAIPIPTWKTLVKPELATVECGQSEA